MNYYHTNEQGAMCGPFTADQMRELYLKGKLHDDSWVIVEGSAEWQPYASLLLLEPAPKPPAGNAVPCANCGAGNLDDAVFCAECGVRLDGSQAPILPPETKHGFTKHAFISHSSQNHELAERICEVLEGYGLNCWIAPRDIDPGEPYDEEIMRGIESSQTFILLLSDAANASPHVKRELMVALRAGHAVYPIRIQEVQPGPKLEYLLEGIHWVDAWTPPIEAHLDRLAQLIVSNDPDVVSASRAAGRKLKGKALWKMRSGTRKVFSVVLLVLAVALLATLWEARKWKTGVIAGIVNYLTEQVNARSNNSPKPAPAAPDNKSHQPADTKREQLATLLVKAKEAADNHQWQTAVNAYETALELSDDPGTRDALARVVTQRDLDLKRTLKREDYKRLIADAVQAEKSGDFPTAQRIYESAAKDAPTDVERAQALEKAKNAGEGLAYRKKKAAFDELILHAREAEDKKDWQEAINIYTQASAAAPDETLAAQVRVRKAQIVEFVNGQKQRKGKVDQTVTLSWVRDEKVAKRYPSSGQILNIAGEVIGDLCIEGIYFYTSQNAVISFVASGEKPENKTKICEFKVDDPVGQTRVGKAGGMSISGRVMEIKREGAWISIITIQFKVTR